MPILEKAKKHHQKTPHKIPLNQPFLPYFNFNKQSKNSDTKVRNFKSPNIKNKIENACRSFFLICGQKQQITKMATDFEKDEPSSPTLRIF